MPIIGIGTDIVEISRIKNAMSESFIKRFFTEAEAALISSRGANGAQTAAADFAAKEAAVKALGCGFSGISPIEVEILRDKNGRPYITLHGAAKERANALGAAKIHASLSHGRDTAIAFVVIES